MIPRKGIFSGVEKAFLVKVGVSSRPWQTHIPLPCLVGPASAGSCSSRRSKPGARARPGRATPLRPEAAGRPTAPRGTAATAWTRRALPTGSRAARRRTSSAARPPSLREGPPSRLSRRGKRHCEAPGLRRKRSRRAWKTPTTRAGSERRARAPRRHRSARETLWRHCQTLPRKGMPLPQLPPPQSLRGRAPTSQKKVQRKSPVCQVRARRRPQARRKPTLSRACSASRRRRAPGTRETAP